MELNPALCTAAASARVIVHVVAPGAARDASWLNHGVRGDAAA